MVEKDPDRMSDAPRIQNTSPNTQRLLSMKDAASWYGRDFYTNYYGSTRLCEYSENYNVSLRRRFKSARNIMTRNIQAMEWFSKHSVKVLEWLAKSSMESLWFKTIANQSQ